VKRIEPVVEAPFDYSLASLPLYANDYSAPINAIATLTAPMASSE
jgi:hypothetical protein